MEADQALVARGAGDRAALLGNRILHLARFPFPFAALPCKVRNIASAAPYLLRKKATLANLQKSRNSCATQVGKSARSGSAFRQSLGLLVSGSAFTATTDSLAMSNNKREADAPAAAAREGTPSKRPRIDDGASVAPVPAVKDISQASGATAAAGEAPSSPFNPKETDSPSVRGKKAGGGRGGGRSCGRGGKGGKNGDKPDSRSGRSRNAEAAASKAKKEGWKEKDGAAGKNAEGSAPGAGGDDKSDRLPKRKVAILLGYNGIGYKGSQMCVTSPSRTGFLPGRSLRGNFTSTATRLRRRSRERCSRRSLRPVPSARTTRQTRKRFAGCCYCHPLPLD